MKIKKGQNMKNNIEVPKETINKKCNKIAYTEQDLIDIFNWNPLDNEEWNGFHIASSISVLPAGKTKKRDKSFVKKIHKKFL
jgi:hypothetical protein